MYLLSLYFYRSMTCLLKVVPNVQGVEICPQIHTDTGNSRGTCIINNGGILFCRHFTFIRHCLSIKLWASTLFRITGKEPLNADPHKVILWKKNSLKIKKPDHRTVKSMAQLSSWHATVTRPDFRVRAFRVICLKCDNWSPSKGSKRTKTNTDTRHGAENTANFSTQRLLKKWEAFPLMLIAHSTPELLLLVSGSGSGLAIHAWW